MNLRTKLVIVLWLTGLLAISVTGWFAYHSGRRSLTEATYARLTAVRESKKRQIETYFHALRNHAATLSTSPITREAMRAFKSTFHEAPTTRQPPDYDPLAIMISASAVGETGHGTLAVWAPSSAASYEVVIPPADCRRFRFYPGGQCKVSGETPAGSTTTMMVAYEATDDRPRRGRLQIDFADPAREDLEVPLRGRVGAGKNGFRKITLD